MLNFALKYIVSKLQNRLFYYNILLSRIILDKDSSEDSVYVWNETARTIHEEKSTITPSNRG